MDFINEWKPFIQADLIVTVYRSVPNMRYGTDVNKEKYKYNSRKKKGKLRCSQFFNTYKCYDLQITMQIRIWRKIPVSTTGRSRLKCKEYIQIERPDASLETACDSGHARTVSHPKCQKQVVD